MASHTGITTWSLAGSDHVISPAGSSAPSIVSVDSILSDTHKKSHGTLQAPESPIRSQAIESLGNSGKYPGVDGSFIRHPKYFFADGNITFLVRDVLMIMVDTPYLMDKLSVGRGHTLLHSSLLLLARLDILRYPICAARHT
jgi:hypothetical protein